MIGRLFSSKLGHVARTHQPSGLFCRALASQVSAQKIAEEPSPSWMAKMRNIGISAHIDSGKTTLTERILFYTGRINAIHDVRGRDGVGAKMDSMDLEREKGITIQSAATFCEWKNDHYINIIDTPGHVDFTIEVERALRVLDGGILVLCGVSGVQSQSLTVDRQMKRYGVPRLAFINKLDRMGSNPWKVVEQVRKQLKLNAAPVQVPIGLEEKHEGVVDLVAMKAMYFKGPNGEEVQVADIPEDTKSLAEEKRAEMVEKLADVDEEIAEFFLMEEEPPMDVLKAAIRRQTIAHKFVPVFMGSAFKNKGVQPLLDGVCDYLPAPSEIQNYAIDTRTDDEQKLPVECDPEGPLLALAFKLEESRFGQLTYMRIYRGTISKGQFIFNSSNKKKVKVPRLVKMHSNEMQEVNKAQAGDVVALFGVDCASMDTFTEGDTHLSITSMHVPQPVMSLAIMTKQGGTSPNFSKALNRFTKEDPTFRVHMDPETKQMVISGMGELHLEIYVERMKREYNLEVTTGEPKVNFRETITKKAEFAYLHKKQSGGQGQYARVIGYVEPLEDSSQPVEFENAIIGMNIPPEFILACEKGVRDAAEKGSYTGNPMQGFRVVLTDGQTHEVDSSELAFRSAMIGAIREASQKAGQTLLEPLMAVEVECPVEYQGSVIGSVNKRKGLVQSSESDDMTCVIRCDVPLANMFGFSTELRSQTQGKGEFSMEYKEHAEVPRDVREKLAAEYRALREKGQA